MCGFENYNTDQINLSFSVAFPFQHSKLLSEPTYPRGVWSDEPARIRHPTPRFLIEPVHPDSRPVWTGQLMESHELIDFVLIRFTGNQPVFP